MSTVVLPVVGKSRFGSLRASLLRKPLLVLLVLPARASSDKGSQSSAPNGAPNRTEEIVDMDIRAMLVDLAYESEDRTAVMIDRDGCMYRGQGRSDGIVDVEWLYLDDGETGNGTIE